MVKIGKLNRLHYVLGPIALSWTAFNVYVVLSARKEGELEEPKGGETRFLVDPEKLRAKREAKEKGNQEEGEGPQ
eukprot:1159957-Pelagomonas_calceolata.AAC.4